MGSFVTSTPANIFAVSDLPEATQSQYQTALNGKYDSFATLLGQEFGILGIPAVSARETLSVTVPATAASFQVLAGGLGSGDRR